MPSSMEDHVVLSDEEDFKEEEDDEVIIDQSLDLSRIEKSPVGSASKLGSSSILSQSRNAKQSILSSSLKSLNKTQPKISCVTRFSIESPYISFTKGERTLTYLDRSKSTTPGAIYDVHNLKSITGSHSFPKGKRFPEDTKKKDEFPSPVSYYITNTPVSSKFESEPSFSFGGSSGYRTSTETDSPGPIYLPREPPPRRSQTPTTFGASKRVLKLNETLDDFPPPGTYSPPNLDTKHATSFPLASKEDLGIYYGEQLSTSKEFLNVPGPKYDPSYKIIMSTSPSYTFGSKTLPPGSKMNDPGPDLQNIEKSFASQSFTMTGKEKLADKSILPQATRARFINEAFLFENLGRASPGPKYNTAGSIVLPSKRKDDSCGFGKAKDFKKRGKKKDAHTPYYGYAIAKTSVLPSDSPGPAYSPNLSFCSQVPTVNSPAIVPHKEKRKVPKDDTQPSMYLPKMDALSSTPNFATAPKFVKGSVQLNRSAFLKPTSVSPGPVYQVDWDTIASTTGSKKHGSKFGGLS